MTPYLCLVSYGSYRYVAEVFEAEDGVKAMTVRDRVEIRVLGDHKRQRRKGALPVITLWRKV